MNIVVQCPKCGNRQRYENRGKIGQAHKRCVYCGKFFKVYTHVDSLNRIVKFEKGRNTGPVNKVK
jgi:uncharacterized Zn finger protein